MLTLKSYEQSNEFSALNSDELFFINGGSGGHPIMSAAGNYLTTAGKNITNSIATDASSAAGSVAYALGSASSWTTVGDFCKLGGYVMQALGACITWVANNDSGDVNKAMDCYYEHH